MGWIVGIIVFVIIATFILLLNRGSDRRINDQEYRRFTDNEQQEALAKSNNKHND